jgi:spore coat polysaccharide biosynthesis predicted glycosyltransferase SpsG
VLVVTGSGGGDVGADLARALNSALPDAAVTLVRGPYAPEAPPGISTLEAPESLLEPFLAADLVVGGAGQTMLEAAATGTPSVALPLVDNQNRQARTLEVAGAARVADPPTLEAAVTAACDLVADKEARRCLSERAQKAVDGFGALRVAYQVAALAERDHPE